MVADVNNYLNDLSMANTKRDRPAMKKALQMLLRNTSALEQVLTTQFMWVIYHHLVLTEMANQNHHEGRNNIMDHAVLLDICPFCNKFLYLEIFIIMMYFNHDTKEYPLYRGLLLYWQFEVAILYKCVLVIHVVILRFTE